MAPKLVSEITEQKFGKDGYCTNMPKEVDANQGIGVVGYTIGRGKSKKTFQAAVGSTTDKTSPNFWVEAQQLLIKKLKEENKI